MDAINGIRQFERDRLRARVALFQVWADGYFDAWAWMQRARWVFAQQYGYTYLRVENALQRRNNGRASRFDGELLARWDFVLWIHGDIDRYVQVQAQIPISVIDAAIDGTS